MFVRNARVKERALEGDNSDAPGGWQNNRERPMQTRPEEAEATEQIARQKDSRGGREQHFHVRLTPKNRVNGQTGNATSQGGKGR